MKKRVAIVLVSFFVLLFLGLVFLLATEPGLIFIQKGVNRFAGDMLSIGQVRGSLLGDGSLTDIRFVSADVDVGVERLDYSWRPGRLLRAELNIAKVVVSGVDVGLKDTPQVESPNASATSDALELPADLLPFAVLLESLEVNKLRIIDSDGQDLFVVDKVITSLESRGKQLKINDFDFQSPEISLVLHGNIAIDSSWTLDLQGDWRLSGFEFHPTTGTFSATGLLTAPHLDLVVQSPADIRVAGDFANLLENPQWTAKLEAKNVDLSTLIVDCPKIELATVHGGLTGSFADYRGHVVADGAWDTLKGMHLVSDIDGDFLGIDFHSLRIDKQESSAEAIGGKISWQDIFSWQGRFLFKNFDPSVIVEELQGKVTAELVSAGDVKDNGVIASFEIINLDGVLSDHKVSAVGNVFLTETDVRTDGLTIRSGEVTGLAYIENALFSWAKEPSWSGKIRLDHFDPSWLNPEFPGSINGEFEGQGKLAEKGLEGSLHIKKISGTLRGNDLSGGGELSYSGDTFHTTGLVLKSGLSELVVNGEVGDSLALKFALTSPDIGTLLPEGKGSILLQGNLQGNRNDPKVDAKIEGNGVSYGEDSLGRLQAEIHAGLKSDGKLSASILADKISVAGFSIDKGAIRINGSLAKHQIVVDGSGDIGTLGLEALGTYSNEWHGELSHFHLDAADYGVWRQEKKAALKIGETGILLERLCLTDEKSSVCLGGDVRLGKEVSWTAQGELSSLPLKWLNRLRLTDVPVSGQVQATIAASGNSTSVVSAKAEVRVLAAEMSVDVQNAEMVPFRVDNSHLTLDLAHGLLQTNLIVQIQNGGQLVLAADVSNAGKFSVSLNSQPLKGSLELKDFDLAILSNFTGYGVEPTGRVNNSFVLAGTLGQPKVSGELSIEDGDIYLPYQGITLQDVSLAIEAGEESALVHGKATSGSGQVAAVGTIKYGTEGVEGVLNIRGSDFLLVSLPEYVIKVNPDVQLTFTKDKGQIKGTVEIPYGLITPEEMSDSISASEDVIFVSGAEEERVQGWPFNMDVNVRLGDDVRIDGYGLTGRLVGKLRVYTTPDDSIAGRGELDLIDGSFTLYSRSLKIKRGRVLFTGGPIDNPGVDVRAQVKVSDKEALGEGYTVGVDISGLVQDLKYHLFSDPYMDDTEIISFMVVGHSLANSTEDEGNMLEAAAVLLGTKGSSEYTKEFGNLLFIDDLHLEGSSSKENVSVVVGKHLTEDLYIGYDLNMFTQLGQFRVRYDLTHGFSVETRSSAEATGADLIYLFQK